MTAQQTMNHDPGPPATVEAPAEQHIDEYTKALEPYGYRTVAKVVG